MKKAGMIGLLLLLTAAAVWAAGSGEASSASARGPVTVRFWETVNDADPNDFMNKWTRENIDLFQKANPDIVIEFTNTANGDQYLNKLSTEMAANNVPDVFMTWTAGRLQPFVEANRVHQLNDIIAASPVLSKTVNKGNASAATFDGKIYAIPNEVAAEVIYYNKAIFAKYGLSEPKTWDDLLNIIAVLKKNGVQPFALANRDPWPGTIPYMAIFDRVNGGEEYKKTAFQEQAVFNADAYKKAASYLVQLVKLGAYPANFNSLEGTEGQSMLRAGKAAMRYNGTWEMPGHIEALKDDLGVFNWPNMVSGIDRQKDGWLTVQNHAFAIGESSKNKAEAARFLEFLLSPERQKVLAEHGYMIAAQNIPFDASKLHPVAATVSKAVSSANNPILIWDVMLGQNIGKELNLATQAILGGADIDQTFDKLNKIAQTEWN